MGHVNPWVWYLAIGVGIGSALMYVDAIDDDPRGCAFGLITLLWPLAIPFFIWHAVSVLRWKRARRRRGHEDADPEQPPTLQNRGDGMRPRGRRT